MARRLTEQQRLWARYYVVDFNATKAAREAGYTEHSAATQGYTLSHNPIVGLYVAELMAKRNKRIDINADYVLRRLIEIDTLDVLDIIDDEGDLIPIRKWPKAWRTSISGIELKELFSAKGDTNAILKKIKWPDKPRNLEMLGKHIDVRAWDKDSVATVEINNIMPIPTADSVEGWEEAAQKQQADV